MKTLATYIAINRFGLGPRPEEADAVEKDPKKWIKAQIKRSPETPTSLKAFMPSEEIVRLSGTARAEKKQNKSSRQKIDKLKSSLRENAVRETFARTEHMIATDTPFVERMVMFWSNHFTVSGAGKGNIFYVAPAYEREAIRPHIFGKFEDLLIAVVQHPAMLTYLDNHKSIGPHSRMGINRSFKTGVKSGLNENLAREILELHTLGVNGGYTQVDVIEFAKSITGWSHGAIRQNRDYRPMHGRFEFKKNFHEPDSKNILGKKYREKGVKTGEAVLKDLARHPSTARFIATKLARHFIADDPPDRAVTRLAEVFTKTNGDLADVTKALIELDEVWTQAHPKIKTHYELMVSAFRASGRSGFKLKDFSVPLQAFAHVPFQAPSPAGWSDMAPNWIAPESLLRRVEWLRQFAATLPANWNPQKFLDDVIGPVATDETRSWVSRAPSADAALALILSSPEFQRR